MATYEIEDITAGDIVAVRHGTKGRQEGLVIGSHIDYHVSTWTNVLLREKIC
jgi:hypothetical protein